MVDGFRLRIPHCWEWGRRRRAGGSAVRGVSCRTVRSACAGSEGHPSDSCRYRCAIYPRRSVVRTLGVSDPDSQYDNAEIILKFNIDFLRNICVECFVVKYCSFSVYITKYTAEWRYDVRNNWGNHNKNKPCG